MEAMLVAERTVYAYRSRKQAGDWAAWAADNQAENRLLIAAVMGLNDGIE